MRKQFAILTAVFSISLAGCLEDWLVTTPQTILTDEQVYSDPALIRGMMADYYDRIPFSLQEMGRANNEGFFGSFRNFGEAMGQSPNLGTTNNPGPANQGNPAWNTGTWGLLRDIHVTINGVTNSTADAVDNDRAQLLAELRFIRALWYFTMVRSYGGIPLLEDQLIYDLSGDLTTVQVPRATEAETWDFILSELDAIMDDLGNDGSYSRANRGAALAFKSRAALYAASSARYNNEMVEPLVTPGWEAGIPASRAEDYFTQSLQASRALITGGDYSLHTGSDRSAAFTQIFNDKGNNEVIMAKDFGGPVGKPNDFTLVSSPASYQGERYLNWGNNTLSPTLNVVERFDRLNGSSGTMVGNGAANILLYGNGATMTGSEWTYYDNLDDIFDGYDARMKGTVMVPGGTWYGVGGSPDLLAGVYEWTGSSYARRDPPEPDVFHPVFGKQTGKDGPFNSLAYSSATGFNMQKYLDPDAAARRYTPGGSTWEIWFRLGEIYLNAAEAAFELGFTSEALGYINTLRERAGFPANSLATINRETIRKERENELVFESHLMWDLRRWRIAHERWNGVESNESTRLWVLFPYRIHRPGHPNHGKYVFNRFRSDNNTNSMNFGLGSYWAGIGGRNGNPLLVCNPLQGGC